MCENLILVAEDIRKVYRLRADKVVALYGLDFEVPRGQFVAVMGRWGPANGSGRR